MFVSALSMSFMNVMVKVIKMNTQVQVLQVSYFRAIIMILGCYAHASYARVNVIEFDQKHSFMILLRSFTGYFAITF